MELRGFAEQIMADRADAIVARFIVFISKMSSAKQSRSCSNRLGGRFVRFLSTGSGPRPTFSCAGSSFGRGYVA